MAKDADAAMRAIFDAVGKKGEHRCDDGAGGVLGPSSSGHPRAATRAVQKRMTRKHAAPCACPRKPFRRKWSREVEDRVFSGRKENQLNGS